MYRLFLWCRLTISSDFALAKKMRLDTRIRMHWSRASGASNLWKYRRFCATGLLSVWPDLTGGTYITYYLLNCLIFYWFLYIFSKATFSFIQIQIYVYSKCWWWYQLWWIMMLWLAITIIIVIIVIIYHWDYPCRQWRWWCWWGQLLRVMVMMLTAITLWCWSWPSWRRWW